MKNFGKVIFSTGLALSLGAFLIASPLFAETAKTDAPAATPDKPAADKPATDKKPMKKKSATAKTSTKKKAAKKDDGAMKPADEKKMDAPAAK